MSDTRCVWHRIPKDKPQQHKRTDWLTGCGVKAPRIGRGWIYCPYCSKEIRKAL